MENTLLDLVINWDQTSRADRSSSFVCGWGKKEKKKSRRDKDQTTMKYVPVSSWTQEKNGKLQLCLLSQQVEGYYQHKQYMKGKNQLAERVQNVLESSNIFVADVPPTAQIACNLLDVSSNKSIKATIKSLFSS